MVLLACLLFAGCSSTAGDDIRESAELEQQRPVVVVGVGGLTWDHVSQEGTPHLWGLLADGAAAGGVTVRQDGVACPMDGWLSLSAVEFVAGRGPVTAGGEPVERVEADDLGGPGDPGEIRDPEGMEEDIKDLEGVRDDEAAELTPHERYCGELPDVRTIAGGGAEVPGWENLKERQDDSVFDPELGRLAETLAESDACATAVGPGAALALADGDGVVSHYQEALGSGAFQCPLTLVDAGFIVDPSSDPSRIDDRVDDILRQLPADATVMVTGVSEEPGGFRQLAVGIVADESLTGAPRYLISSSTRWNGVVRLLDLPRTLLESVEVSAPADFDGGPIELGGERPADTADTVTALNDITRADQVRGTWARDLRNYMLLLQVVVYGLALLAVRWGWRPRGSGRVFTAGVLVLAAVPVATYLVNLSGWWRSESPGRVMWIGIAIIATVIAIVVGLVRRYPVWWATGCLTLLTFTVLVMDALAGTPLHRGSVLGLSPATGDRYFGFGNDTFAVFVVAASLLSGAVAAELLARGRRNAAVAAVIAIGSVTVVVDVWPGWGADVGGGLSLLPGIALLTLVVADVSVTVFRMAIAALAGVALVAVVAVLDWLRSPTERSHLGRFVQSIVDGDAWTMLERKAGYVNRSLDGSLVAWVTLALFVAAAAALLRPGRYAPRPLREAFSQWPTFRAAAGASLISVILGSLVNDYGLKLGTIALAMGMPLIALTCARALSPAGVERKAAAEPPVESNGSGKEAQSSRPAFQSP